MQRMGRAMSVWSIVVLLALAGLGRVSASDPYLERVSAGCSEGSIFDCFKLKSLTWLDEALASENISVGEYGRLVKMPQSQLLRLIREPYEFSDTPRSSDSEWSLLLKFLSRRAERFVKSTALEVTLADGITAGDRYRPRFIDEIYTEIDAFEDKNEKPHKRDQLKKLLIPLLVILKLFKLKLLLFLPLVLGLASFKKFLGFLAVVAPVLIGYFKLCKPDLGLGYGSYGHSSFYNRPPIRHSYREEETNRKGNQDVYDRYETAHDMAYSGYRNK